MRRTTVSVEDQTGERKQESAAVPRMPGAGEIDPAAARRWRRQLRRFHLTGERPPDLDRGGDNQEGLVNRG